MIINGSGTVKVNGQKVSLNNAKVLDGNVEIPVASTEDLGSAESGMSLGENTDMSLLPPFTGSIASGAEEFAKRGEKLVKSTTPLKSTGKPKYYDNAWGGNQYIKTENVFNNKVLKGVSKGVWGAGIALDVMEVYDGYKADGNVIGKNTMKEASGVAGGIGVGAGGAWVGAVAGTAVFPKLDSLIGGTVGSIGGSLGGESLFEWGAEQILEEGE